MVPMAEVEYITDDQKLATIQKAIRLTVRWMPSHLKLAGPRPDSISDLDIITNGHADMLAGQAAKRACVPQEVSTTHIKYSKLITNIQKRLYTILMSLPDRKHEYVIRPPRSSSTSVKGWYVRSASQRIQ